MTEAFDILNPSILIKEDHLRARSLLAKQETLECEGDHPVAGVTEEVVHLVRLTRLR